MSEAREAILAKLRRAVPEVEVPVPDYSVIRTQHWEPRLRVEQLRERMEAVKTEFLEATEADWPQGVAAFAAREGLANLLYGPGTPEGQALAAAWTGATRLVPYDRPVEEFKEDLFYGIQAGFTTTLGGVSETGGLLLAPGPLEPRLLSLVPPIHIALLREDRIFDTLYEGILNLGWNALIPRHALVISGPSKTADIEQTLAYGVHGPKRLVVVLVGSSGPPSFSRNLPKILPQP